MAIFKGGLLNYFGWWYEADSMTGGAGNDSLTGAGADTLL